MRPADSDETVLKRFVHMRQWPMDIPHSATSSPTPSGKASNTPSTLTSQETTTSNHPQAAQSALAMLKKFSPA